MARRIAKTIVEKRKISPILTTTELAAIVSRAVSHEYGGGKTPPPPQTPPPKTTILNKKKGRGGGKMKPRSGLKN